MTTPPPRRSIRGSSAVGTRRRTGSWFTEFVTVDRQGGAGTDPPSAPNWPPSSSPTGWRAETSSYSPRAYVPLDIGLTVYVAAGYFRGTVKLALIQAFSARDLPGGDRGFFHPGNFTFATPVCTPIRSQRPCAHRALPLTDRTTFLKASGVTFAAALLAEIAGIVLLFDRILQHVSRPESK
jgi:hypothetical protein